MEEEMVCLFFRDGLENVISCAQFSQWVKSRDLRIDETNVRNFSCVRYLFIEEYAKMGAVDRKMLMGRMCYSSSILFQMTHFIDYRKICAELIDKDYIYDDLFSTKFLVCQNLRMTEKALEKWPQLKIGSINYLINYGTVEDFRNFVSAAKIELDEIVRDLHIEIYRARHHTYVDKVKKILDELGVSYDPEYLSSMDKARYIPMERIRDKIDFVRVA